MRLVKISPGKKASRWRDCLQNNHICVGFRQAGDLRRLHSVKEIQDVINKKRYDGRASGTAKLVAEQLWTVRNLAVGDRVIANEGNSVVLNAGTVAGRYRWSASHEYHHVVPVKWQRSFERKKIASQSSWNNNTVADVSPALFRLITRRTPRLGKATKKPARRRSRASTQTVIADSPRHHQLDYLVRSRQQMRLARKNEERLLRDYRHWLALQKRTFKVARHGKLQCDLLEVKRNILIEAKSSIRREHIRMAVGQLLDYAFQIRNDFPKLQMAILVPAKPEQHSINWLKRLRVAVVWRNKGVFLDDANGAIAGRKRSQ